MRIALHASYPLRLLSRFALGVLTLSLASAACDGGDGTSQNDTSDLTQACAGAHVDDSGFCRASNGQFAKVSCCASSSVCAEATVDANGICRRQDNGEFAPTACCTALCDGAKLDSGGHCRASSGRFAPRGCCASACLSVQQTGGDTHSVAACDTAWQCGDLENWASDNCAPGSDGSVDWDACFASTPKGDLSDLGYNCCYPDPTGNSPIWCADLYPGCAGCEDAYQQCLDGANTDEAQAECEDTHTSCILIEC